MHVYDCSTATSSAIEAALVRGTAHFNCRGLSDARVTMSDPEPRPDLLKVKGSDVVLVVLLLIVIFYVLPMRYVHYRRGLHAATTPAPSPLKSEWCAALAPGRATIDRPSTSCLID